MSLQGPGTALDSSPCTGRRCFLGAALSLALGMLGEVGIVVPVAWMFGGCPSSPEL